MLSCPANLFEFVATTAGLPPLTSGVAEYELRVIPYGPRVAAKLIWFVAFLSTASRRAARGNNDRLSTPWREVISLAGVARSFSQSIVVLKLSVPPPRRDAGLRSQEAQYAKQ